MKINNPIKFIRGISVIVILLFAIIALFFNKTYAKKTYENKTIIVSEGQTLWNIAQYEKDNNDYYKEKDIRRIIYEIKEKNKLNTCDLKVGQKLNI